MQMIKVLGFALLLSFCNQSLAESDLFHNMLGTWYSDQPVFGSPARTELRLQPALGDQFIRLEYRIEQTPEESDPSHFEGIAFYKRSISEGVVGYWADTSGFLHPIRVTLESNRVTSTWGNADGKLGRTEYRLLENGRLQTTDWIKSGDGWQQFNRNEYSRVADGNREEPSHTD